MLQSQPKPKKAKKSKREEPPAKANPKKSAAASSDATRGDDGEVMYPVSNRCAFKHNGIDFMIPLLQLILMSHPYGSSL